MKKFTFTLLIFFTVVSCQKKDSKIDILEGTWKGELEIANMKGGYEKYPITFVLKHVDGDFFNFTQIVEFKRGKNTPTEGNVTITDEKFNKMYLKNIKKLVLPGTPNIRKDCFLTKQ